MSDPTIVPMTVSLQTHLIEVILKYVQINLFGLSFITTNFACTTCSRQLSIF